MPGTDAAVAKRLVWLASYPKSGNTWLRILLANYLRDDEGPVDINHLEGSLLASSRRLFDELAGVSAADLFPAEITGARPAAFSALAREARATVFVKVHDALRPRGGAALVPRDETAAVIYAIRNPLDVAVSWAHHQGKPIATVVDDMCRNHVLEHSGRSLPEQLEQALGTWSSHVRGWVDAPDFDVHVVRYEDMLEAPHDAFAAVVRAAGLSVDARRVEQAVDCSRFERLQAHEAEFGFRERHPDARVFFRAGRSGGWAGELSSALIARLVDAHGETMRRFGYLDSHGRLVA